MEIHDHLLQFTIFQGMSHADLMEVVGHTKLGFTKLAAGKWLVKEGEPCSHLYFLTNGTLHCETSNDNHSYRVVEHMAAPYMLPCEQLFGLSPLHTSSYKAETPCNLITIDKQEVRLLLETQLVFRLNVLNTLAAETQRLRHRAWRSAPRQLRERVIRFLFSRCLYPAGSKTFFILMKQMAEELNASRLDISHVLNEMQNDNLLTLHRGRIEIPMIERLLM